MEQRRSKVLVAGGGITGLSAAFYVQQQAKQHNLPIDIMVAEQSDRWGGKIRTLHRDGFVIERGPDSFLARKRPVIDLTLDLGLEHELVATNPQASNTYIVSKGKLHRMPKGLVLGIPTQWQPFLRSGILSPSGKLRAMMDLVIPSRKNSTDESLGQFLERRLGREVLERLVEPLLAGIYAGDTYRLSLMATFPQFREAEQKHGSLIRGTIASRKAGASLPQTRATGATAELPPAVRHSMFLTYRNGLSTLVNTLVNHLETDIALENNCTITAIARTSEGIEGAEGRYLVKFSDGTSRNFDAIIMTLPVPVTAGLLVDVPEISPMKQMSYISVANVVMAFRSEDIQHRLDGSGFLVPRGEGRLITACTWTSRKWLHTAPQGYELLRCYVGRSGAEDWQELSDERILQGVRHDLQDLIGLTAEPLFYEITRLPHSMPQYPVDHLEQIHSMRDQLQAIMPGVVMTGAGFHGVGIPDCIRQGKEAAELICDFIRKSNL